jgi:hypothetical protein
MLSFFSSHNIQSAIIRIRKARQTLKNALLMQEVIQQLSSRFQPKIPLIKVNFIKTFHRRMCFVFLL